MKTRKANKTEKKQYAEILKEIGITRKELAAFLSCNPAFLGQVIAGKRKAAEPFFRKLNKTLGMNDEGIHVNSPQEIINRAYEACEVQTSTENEKESVFVITKTAISLINRLKALKNFNPQKIKLGNPVDSYALRCWLVLKGILDNLDEIEKQEGYIYQLDATEEKMVVDLVRKIWNVEQSDTPAPVVDDRLRLIRPAAPVAEARTRLIRPGMTIPAGDVDPEDESLYI